MFYMETCPFVGATAPSRHGWITTALVQPISFPTLRQRVCCPNTTTARVQHHQPPPSRITPTLPPCCPRPLPSPCIISMYSTCVPPQHPPGSSQPAEDTFLQASLLVKPRRCSQSHTRISRASSRWTSTVSPPTALRGPTPLRALPVQVRPGECPGVTALASRSQLLPPLRCAPWSRTTRWVRSMH